jgi:hypothetical protein
MSSQRDPGPRGSEDISQLDVYAKIGAALCLVQTAEEVIRTCITYVLPKTSPLTIEDLERQTNAERKKTLGYFLGELRKRADLDEDFDALLASFLENRNTLVHRIGEVPGWTLRTAEGRKIASIFAGRLLTETLEVIKIFAGLLSAWQEQTKIDMPFPRDNELGAEIEEKYKTLVDDVFFEKGS